VIYICKLLTELGLNPKSFIRSFLEIDDSDLKLRQSYWGIWRGWQSTFALAVIILRSQNPASGIHPNGSYISSAAITPAIFDVDSKEHHRERLTEPTNKVDAPQVGPIEALEEELMEREGFPFTRGNNGSTSRRHRYE
ncbi:hypothetical protein PSHT_06688, partial [Puccinia striiformis]